MNSKRVKLRVASACTAALMMGCMMASSVSVFASSPVAGIVLPTAEQIIYNQPVEQWLAEVEQMESRFQEATNEKTASIDQKIATQQEELARLRESSSHLHSPLSPEAENAESSLVDGVLERQIARQKSLLQSTLRQRQSYHSFLRRSRNEKEKYLLAFRELTAELIRLQEERDQFRAQVESKLEDIDLKNQLRRREILVAQQKRRTQLVFELVKDCYHKIINALERPELQWRVFASEAE